MLKDSRIIYLFIYVNDLEASRKFYEGILGFRVLEEDSDSVKYDAGDIILALNRAKENGIQVGGSRDETALIVFHVDDIDAMRTALEEQGIVFDPTLRYDIGATAAFYDLDGHWFTLYEPSEDAMTWPSGEKIRTILHANVTPANEESMPTSHPSTKVRLRNGLILGSRMMVYLFLFITNFDDTLNFYHKNLGLRILEEDLREGVIKYDGGGIILATHLIYGDPSSAERDRK